MLYIKWDAITDEGLYKFKYNWIVVTVLYCVVLKSNDIVQNLNILCLILYDDIRSDRFKILNLFSKST